LFQNAQERIYVSIATTINVGSGAKKNQSVRNIDVIIPHIIVKMDVNLLIGLSLKCEVKNEESDISYGEIDKGLEKL